MGRTGEEVWTAQTYFVALKLYTPHTRDPKLFWHGEVLGQEPMPSLSPGGVLGGPG